MERSLSNLYARQTLIFAKDIVYADPPTPYRHIYACFKYTYTFKIEITLLMPRARLYSIFQDSVYVLASAIKEMITNETITEAPKDCDDSGTIWESGE